MTIIMMLKFTQSPRRSPNTRFYYTNSNFNNVKLTVLLEYHLSDVCSIKVVDLRDMYNEWALWMQI